MNYIKKLQNRVEILEEESKRANEKINDFLVYLYSSKFHQDTTIQVREVINRLLNIRMDLI